jgi:hypothetical protein
MIRYFLFYKTSPKIEAEWMLGIGKGSLITTVITMDHGLGFSRHSIVSVQLRITTGKVQGKVYQ